MAPKGKVNKIEVVEEVAPAIAVPDPVADAGTRLYVDRAGQPINVGLTEGSSNFATITAEARRAAANPET